MMRKNFNRDVVYPAMAVAVAAIFFSAPQIHAQQNEYTQVNLVSSGYVPAKVTDPNLINPWGLVAGPTSPLWTSNQATNTSSVYAVSALEMGMGASLTVKIPTVTAAGPANGPTGIVFNSASSSFELPGAMGMVPSVFIFDNLNGTISGWNPGSTGGAASAVIAVDNSEMGASYTGLALGVVASKTYLYATNFTPQGGVEVYDSSFKLVTGLPYKPFDADGYLPGLPSDEIWRPYNIANIGGYMIVSYAALPAAGGLPITGKGLGAVAAFTLEGKFLGIVAKGGRLDAPWGMAWAPDGFGKFSKDLLVGNFGNGRILAYRLPTSDGDNDRDDSHFTFAGFLRDSNHKIINNGFLWTLMFGNGANGADPHTLYITTGGPNQATDGLLAAIAAEN